MPKDFFPRREADVLSWGNVFKAAIISSPGSYGISVSQAADFGAKYDSFAALYQAAHDNSTRTPSVILGKRTALAALQSEARLLARIIRANPAVTNEMRQALGLSLSQSGGGTPIQAPASAPYVTVVSVAGNTVKLRLWARPEEKDAIMSTNRGRPRGVIGAAIFAHVGSQPPTSSSDWTFKGNTTRTTSDVTFDTQLPPGTTVWLTAYWFNPRAAHGPTAAPVSTNLGYGITLPHSMMMRAA